MERSVHRTLRTLSVGDTEVQARAMPRELDRQLGKVVSTRWQPQ